MGGAIRIVIIRDKKPICKTRWTNNYPDFIQHHKFINRNNEWIDEYINRKSDYSSDDDDFSPDGYGLIVLDIDQKKLYECQGYAGLRTIYLAGISLEMHGMIWKDEDYDPDYDKPAVVKKMIELGMLQLKKWNEPNPYPLTETFEEIMGAYDKNFRNSHVTTPEFYIDWEKFGWEHHRFDECEEGYESFFKMINEHYILSELEKQHWMEWINERLN